MTQELNDKQIAALKPPEVEQRQTTEENCVVHPLKIECCCCDNCPQLRTRTIAYNAGAQPGQSSAGSALAQVNALEANGWLILGHSVVEVLPAGGQVAGQRIWLITLGYYV